MKALFHITAIAVMLSTLIAAPASAEELNPAIDPNIVRNGSIGDAAMKNIIPDLRKMADKQIKMFTGMAKAGAFTEGSKENAQEAPPTSLPQTLPTVNSARKDAKARARKATRDAAATQARRPSAPNVGRTVIQQQNTSRASRRSRSQ